MASQFSPATSLDYNCYPSNMVLVCVQIPIHLRISRRAYSIWKQADATDVLAAP